MRDRIQLLAVLPACLLAAAPSLTAAAGVDDDSIALAQQAQSAVAALAAALKTELSAAMAAGGPTQAIDVCHARAPAIAGEISRLHRLHISRVSLRYRNPGNAPAEWQAGVLESFQARREAGEDPGSLVWQEVAETGNGREYRYMKAIPTQPVCLACHGTAIAPPVKDKLAELYPEDTATGFAEGDLRGAFVVTRSLD